MLVWRVYLRVLKLESKNEVEGIVPVRLNNEAGEGLNLQEAFPLQHVRPIRSMQANTLRL